MIYDHKTFVQHYASAIGYHYSKKLCLTSLIITHNATIPFSLMTVPKHFDFFSLEILHSLNAPKAWIGAEGSI